eukprot:298473-Ditylum_brightwellii.AAC.1
MYIYSEKERSSKREEEDNELEAQCGSINSKGGQDTNFSLKLALQIYQDYDLTTHVLFVDL